ncbi:MAG TPA: gluconate 2-dehydrogenase subunit 3 family protein [Dongiaceae bacterium]
MPDHPPTTWYELLPPAARPNRRFVLKAAVGAGALLSVLGPAAAQTPQALLDGYEPVYFSKAEWAFVRAACARLIPSEGEGPGAIEAQVPVFIDKQMAGDFGSASDWCMIGPHDANADPRRGFQSPLTPAQIYRQGIASVDEWCQKHKGKLFAALDASAQDEALTELQAGNIPLTPELRNFFEFLLQNTKEGFFADPMYGGNYKMVGWKHIGFPGARANFLEWANDKGEAYPLGPVSISGERG